jgi:hypothetical protein
LAEAKGKMENPRAEGLAEAGATAPSHLWQAAGFFFLNTVVVVVSMDRSSGVRRRQGFLWLVWWPLSV